MSRDLARAKINLTLHVGKSISDKRDKYYGYHPLSSLVVFADFGDAIELSEAANTRLDITGPFASELRLNAGNLLTDTLEAVRAQSALPDFHIRLIKNIPIAAGLGGGSADAAALLRLLRPYASLTQQRWQEIALSLGADVPVCLTSQTCVMSGIGQTLAPAPGLGQIPALLVNPGEAVATAEVFAAFDDSGGNGLAAAKLSNGTLAARAAAGKNDLQNPASRLAPVITDVLDRLNSQPGCQLARLSGSGATCFALFEDRDLHYQAARAISEAYPKWWVKAVLLGDYVRGDKL